VVFKIPKIGKLKWKFEGVGWFCEKMFSNREKTTPKPTPDI